MYTYLYTSIYVHTYMYICMYICIYIYNMPAICKQYSALRQHSNASTISLQHHSACTTSVCCATQQSTTEHNIYRVQYMSTVHHASTLVLALHLYVVLHDRAQQNNTYIECNICLQCTTRAL